VYTVIGTTGMAAITFLYNKSKDQKQDKQPIDKDTESK